MAYDINGNKINDLTSNKIKTALIGAIADGSVNLGSTVGATLSYTSPSEAWETNALETYNNMLEIYKTIPNSGVPFFISTDQHGRGMEQHRWLNNTDVNGMNINNINLGDTVQDVYGSSTLNDVLSKTKQIKNFFGVAGNHDLKKGSEEVSEHEITRCFTSTTDRRMIENQRNCYSVLDNAHNTKFIVIEPYEDNGIVSGMPHPYFSTNVSKWLIGELSNNDGYDIVVLCHEPLCKTNKSREETEETEWDDYNVWNLLLARKNKTSGTFTDDDNVEHSYDFANMESDLLCTLHGHTHEELYSVQDGLTSYACDWYGNNNSCTFGIIDRENSKLRIFKFDSTTVYDELQINI